MEYIFDEWKELLDNFAEAAKNVDTKLEEIRRCKEEIQNIKTEIFNAISQGYYLRDDRRIILSAPEIIIGDVDKDGHLWMNNSHSKVILRSNDIYIDGVSTSVTDDEASEGSSIICRANNIVQMAVDPGPAGNEQVVSSGESNILTLAKSVKIGTIDADGVVLEDDMKMTDGVEIHSNKTLKLDASVSDAKKKSSLTKKKELLSSTIERINEEQGDMDNLIKAKFKQIQDQCDQALKLKGTSVENVRSNAMEILDCREQIERLLPSLYDDVNKYTMSLEDIANANREMRAIDNVLNGGGADGEEGNNQDFANSSTGANISINAEQINVTTQDGDGNYRKNKDAGISCNASHIIFAAEATVGEKKEFQKDSYFKITSNDIELFAADQTIDPQNKKVTLEPTGKILMHAKSFKLDSNKFEETHAENQEPKRTILEQNPENSLVINVPTTTISALNKDGGAIGSISLNAKEMTLSSMDVKNEGKDKTITQGSKIEVVAENLNVGKLGEVTSKTAVLDTEKLNLNVKELVEVKQDAGKSSTKMSGGKIEVKAESGIELQSDVTGKGAKFDSLKAKSSLQGPHIKD